ncbi:prepilin-type N-terminal cleavage/methylation domain-containing protein [Verrucomicrobiaceae bacterium N1E253]|uniref:Prepilin-type N-terminal cleavage/methylation domain-containing protein n=1 Tax=Oceaniferula marina TaxID=2748318 RepID=A0A851GAK4_9BACT|nr:prepilin-type N-terminal cleavage/methylation domain-containing protein [Oceaniferula marina]NWK54002.1 prepilin-type N-terminal cleavage/methylation domain-containing protein [Oceaniferula marina]
MNNAQRQIRQGVPLGFTLLEVVFVLGMIAMLAVWLTVSVTTVDTEQQLREAAGEIQSQIKRGRSIAVTQQRAYQVTLGEGDVSLAPQYARSQMPENDRSLPRLFEEDVDSSSMSDYQEVYNSVDLDPEIRYEIRRWRSDIWEEIDGDKKLVFILDPVGLVEPITIRCSKGDSWLMQEIHPLTADVNYEEMTVQE